MLIKNILKYILLILSLLILIILISIVLGESSFILKMLGISSNELTFISGETTYNISLAEKTPLITLVLSSIILLLLAIAFNIDYTLRKLKFFFAFIKDYTISTAKLIASSNAKYFLILPCIAILYLAFTTPIHVDEAMTYLHFARPSMWEAICLYPMPNNHVLHSALTNLSVELPFIDLNIKLRLPAILASFLTWIVAYRFVNKYWGQQVAVFVVAIASVAASTLEYSFLARGYTLIILFVVICMHAAFNIVKENNRQRDWAIFTLASILGLYSIPTFVYPLTSISLCILFFNYKNIKYQVIYSFAILFFTFLLYSPILIVSGIQSLIGNQYVTSIDHLQVAKSLPGYLLGVFVHILGVGKYAVLVILALPILYSLYRKDRKVLILWAILGVTPLLFIGIQGVLPFFRVFFYYGFILVFLIGLSFADLLKKLDKKYLLTALAIVQLLALYSFYTKRDYLHGDMFVAQDNVNHLLKDNASYYVHRHNLTSLLVTHFKYEAEREGYKIKIEMGKEDNADGVEGFDCIIILDGLDMTEQKKKTEQLETIYYNILNIYE